MQLVLYICNQLQFETGTNVIETILTIRNMNHESKIKKLRIFLRVYGVLTLLIFSVISVAFIFQLQDFNPGGKFNWVIWDDVYGHVGPMLVVIYLVWGVYFFVAAKDPVKYRTFLDFTMWANAAHGLLMIPMALVGSMYHSKFLTDIPFILILALGIYLWRPEIKKESPQAR